jgi:hypothetical protein
VSAGEFLQVVQPVDRYWVECCLEQRRGAVPSASVAALVLPRPLGTGQRIAIVRSNIQAREPGDLALTRGQCQPPSPVGGGFKGGCQHSPAQGTWWWRTPRPQGPPAGPPAP